MIGVKDSAYWCSWLLTQTVMVTLGTSIFIAFAYLSKIFLYSSFLLVFLLFFSFSVSTLSTALFFSVFFDKARSASGLNVLYLLLSLGIAVLCFFYVFPHHKLFPLTVLMCVFSSVIPFTEVLLFFFTLGKMLSIFNPFLTHFFVKGDFPDGATRVQPNRTQLFQHFQHNFQLSFFGSVSFDNDRS